MKKLKIRKTKVRNYEQGVDYEILTYVVILKDDHLVPVERFAKRNNLDVSDLNTAIKQIDRLPNVSRVSPTKPLRKGSEVYILDDYMVNYDTATDCGFGIGRFLKGKYAGKYFLYRNHIIGDLYDPTRTDDEEVIKLTLNVYFQLVVDCFDNKSLERYIHTEYGRFMIYSITFTTDTCLVDRLDCVFTSKRGGNNIIQFRKETV